MGIPWNYGPKHFEVTAGQYSLVQLNVPHRGVLRTVNLTVVGGSTGTFEIYDSEGAAEAAVAEGNGSPLSSSSGTLDSPVIGSQVHAGSLAGGVYFNNGLNAAYQNRDGSPSNCIQRLWMRLHPTGAGVHDVVLSMMVDMPHMM